MEGAFIWARDGDSTSIGETFAPFRRYCARVQVSDVRLIFWGETLTRNLRTGGKNWYREIGESQGYMYCGKFTFGDVVMVAS